MLEALYEEFDANRPAAAVAEAQQEGGISDRERSLLNRLRESLDISSTDAESIERELA